MHVSLDGFVGGPNGELNWFHVDDEMFDYTEGLVDECDLGLYGRVTFEMMEHYWPTAADKPNATKHDIEHSRWYKQVPKVVLSNSMQGMDLKNVTILSKDIPDEITTLKKQKGKNIVIFGSPRASYSLMNYNLIDDYWLFINPVIFGEGIPMFKDIKKRINLTFVESKTFTSGVVALHYRKK